MRVGLDRSGRPNYLSSHIWYKKEYADPIGPAGYFTSNQGNFTFTVGNTPRASCFHRTDSISLYVELEFSASHHSSRDYDPVHFL